MMANVSQKKRREVRRILVQHVDMAKMPASVKSLDRVNFKLYSGEQATGGKRKLAYTLFQEYLQCSTIQGVKYFGNSRIKSNIGGKLFWSVIMICSFLFSGWMTWKFWLRYNADPIRTVFQSFHAPIYMIPFPAITLCPLVAPLPTRREEVRKILRVPRNMDDETVTFLLRYGSAFAHETAPGGRAYLNDLKALLRINQMELIDFLIRLRPCEDLLESCRWNGKEKNCSEIFKISYTVTGVCCSFNYLLEDYILSQDRKDNSNFLRTVLFGPTSGLEVILHRELYNHIDNTSIRYSTNSIGLVMFAHHPLEYISTISSRQILQKQQELWIAVKPSMKYKPAGYYHYNIKGELSRYCVDETTKLKYFPTYRYSNCFTSCSIKASLQFCNCVPYYYTPVAHVNSLRICGWEDWECLHNNANNIRIIKNVRNENFTCMCLTPCRNLLYQIQTSSFLLNGKQDFNVSPIYKNITKPQAVLKVFFSSETFTVMNTIPIADRLYLLASLGGIFSLFMGCSFISLIEIFYFLLLFLRSCSSTKKTK